MKTLTEQRMISEARKDFKVDLIRDKMISVHTGGRRKVQVKAAENIGLVE